MNCWMRTVSSYAIRAIAPEKNLNWSLFSLLGPGAYGKSLSGEGGLVEASFGVIRHCRNTSSGTPAHQPRCVIIMLPHIATPLFCALLCLSTATALTFNDHASDDWNDVTSAFSVFDSDDLYKDNSETCNACTFIGTQILNGWTKHAYKLKKWSMKKKTKKATKALTKSCVRCLSCARSLWGQRHLFFSNTWHTSLSPQSSHSLICCASPFCFLSHARHGGTPTKKTHRNASQNNKCV